MNVNLGGLISLDNKSLSVNANQLNSDGIFLCVCNELLGCRVKDPDELQRKITQSETLYSVKKNLFHALEKIRKKKHGKAKDCFEKITCYDDEDIYMDKAGNRVDLSTLKTMELNLFESICEYADERGINIFGIDDEDLDLDRVIKAIMARYPDSIGIVSTEIVNNEDGREGNFAIDVAVKLYGDEWIVQTWDGYISNDCQTTINGNYIELSSRSTCERLVDAINTVCCDAARKTIDSSISADL